MTLGWQYTFNVPVVAAFSDNLNVVPPAATLTLTTFAPNVGYSGSATPGTASLVLTTFAPTIGVSLTVVPTTGSLVLSTFAPAILIAIFQAYRDIVRQIDPGDWTVTPLLFFLEVHGFTNNASFPYQARLWNKTDNQLVSGSQITSTALTSTRLRSASFSLPAGSKEYEVQYGGISGGQYTTEDAVLILDVG